MHAPPVVWTEEMRRTAGGKPGNTWTKFRTTTDQANANAQRALWKKVWKGKDDHKGLKDARDIMQYGDDRIGKKTVHGAEDPVTNVDVEKMRACMRSFKHHTAMSHEALKPHLVAMWMKQ